MTHHLLILISSVGALLACSHTSKSSTDAGSVPNDTGNLPADAGSVPVDAGQRERNMYGNFGLDQCLAPDGEVEPTRVCSPAPTDWIRLDNSDSSDCHGASDAGSGCQLPWECGSYDDALENILKKCGGQGPTFYTLGNSWGYRVIQANAFGAFFTWAFYDQNVGNLVGAYSSTDTGPEMCAGTVPNGSYLTDQLTNTVDPCRAGDAGP